MNKESGGAWDACELGSQPLFSYLCQHKYISIADIQIKNEEELEKCPMSLVSPGIQHTGERTLSAVLSQSTHCTCTESAC